MGTIPTPPTWTAGEKPTAAKMNQVRDTINFWANPPQCQAYDTTGPSLANNTTVTIGLGGEYYDNVQSGDTAAHDNVTNNSRIYCRTAGKYQISGYVSFVSNPTGARQATIVLNGTSTLQAASLPANASLSTNVAVGPITRTLAVGDYVELTGLQTSGAALGLNTVSPGPSTLTIRLISS